MDFRLGATSDALRHDAREFLDKALTDDLTERLHRSGAGFDSEFHRGLSDHGYLAPGWPAEFGGRALDPMEALALFEEFVRADAPTNGASTTMMIAEVVRAIGTDVQREEILRAALTGEIVIALGFSEPHGGSDVFSARTRAERAANGSEDGWLVNGQKIFTTNAEVADFVFVLARTGAAEPKQGGLTTFLVPTAQSGVEVHEVRTMGGERTNITYYNDAFVPDRYRIGEVDGGYQSMAVALTFERGHAYGAELDRLLDFAESWALAADDDGRRSADEPSVADRLGALAIDTEVATLLSRRTIWLAAGGEPAGVQGCMGKLFGSEALSRHSAALLDSMGPDSVRDRDDPLAPSRGMVAAMHLSAQAGTIYGGTSEVQRGVIAQRGLGLPKSF